MKIRFWSHFGLDTFVISRFEEQNSVNHSRYDIYKNTKKKHFLKLKKLFKKLWIYKNIYRISVLKLGAVEK